MSTKVLTGVYHGYSMPPTITTLSIAPTGTILAAANYFALYSNQTTHPAASIINDGKIEGYEGVYTGWVGVEFAGPGSLTNGSASDHKAFIGGINGGVLMLSSYGGNVTNYATIGGGVDCAHGGTVVNASTASVILGVYERGVYLGAANPSALTNLGSISNGVLMNGAATVQNGSASVSTAAITGNGTTLTAVFIGQGTVTNYATLTGGASAYGVYNISGGGVVNLGAISGGLAGVRLESGGSVTNGSTANATATISGASGVQAINFAGTLSNFGHVVATGAGGYGVYFKSGGDVTNATGGVISGQKYGVRLLAAGTVTNYGTIQDGLSKSVGVGLSNGGTLINGSASATGARISGGYGVKASGATVINYAAIGGGVYLTGGQMRNGSATSTAARVNGDSAFFGTSVVNFGELYGYSFGAKLYNGAILDTFGKVYGPTAAVDLLSTNSELIVEAGSQFTGPLVGGGGTLELAGGVGNITSLGGQGTLSGGVEAYFHYFGTYVIGPGAAWTMAGKATLTASQLLLDRGSLTNTGTLISAADAVFISGLNNGVLVNAAGGLITGIAAVIADAGGSGTFVNAGGVKGSGGVSVSFGSKSDTLVVDGGSYFYGAAHGGGGTLELAIPYAVLGGLGGTGSITVGSYLTFSGFGTYRLDKGDTLALTGTDTLGASQVLDNFGTIKGGLTLASSGAAIEAENGSAITSAVVGGGGGLILQGGSSTVTGLGTAAVISGGVSLKGSGFGTYAIQNGATLAVSANGAIKVGQFLSNHGVVNLAANLNVQGALANTGQITLSDGHTLTILGEVSNSGTIAVQGLSAFTDIRVDASGASLTGAGEVTLANAKSRILGTTPAATLTNSSTILGAGFVGASAMGLTNAAGGLIEATGSLTVRVTAGDTLVNGGGLEAGSVGTLALVNETIDQTTGGTILAAGGLAALQGVTVRGGVLAATGGGRINAAGSGATLDGTVVKGGGGAAVSITGLVQSISAVPLTLMGTIANSGKIDLFAGKLIVGSGGVTLSGSGQVNLSSSLSNIVVGATSASTLTNNGNRIAGSGLLGDGSMILNNASGAIVGNQAVALTIDTGASTITNAGTIENIGSGGVVIASAISNKGTLLAGGTGTLTLEGSLTNTGQIQISGGTLYAKSTTFNSAVSFTGATGVLELTKSSTYTAKVTESFKTGKVAFDLLDIVFVAGKTTASFTGPSLTVTNGTVTAHIQLSGVASGTTFTVSDDGHGGVSVTDPPPASKVLASAIAGFAPVPGAHSETMPTPRLNYAQLARPA